LQFAVQQRQASLGQRRKLLHDVVQLAAQRIRARHVVKK